MSMHRLVQVQSHGRDGVIIGDAKERQKLRPRLLKRKRDKKQKSKNRMRMTICVNIVVHNQQETPQEMTVLHVMMCGVEKPGT